MTSKQQRRCTETGHGNNVLPEGKADICITSFPVKPFSLEGRD